MRIRSLLLSTVLAVLATPQFGWSATNGLERVIYGEEALTYASGSIRETMPIDGVVSAVTGDPQTSGDRRLLATGDVSYLMLERPEEASAGDLYTLYRFVHFVNHPADGRHLGTLFNMLGIVEVVEGGSNPVTVKIVRSYHSMLPGDRAMRFVPPPLPHELETEEIPEGEGMIVALPPQRTLTAQNQVVYIDWGTEHGVQPGDALEVYRDTEGFPRRVIGELKVLGVGDRTSSALVVGSKYPYLRGDNFAFKERPERDPYEEEEAPEVVQAEEEPQEVMREPVQETIEVPSVVTPEPESFLAEGLVDNVIFDSGEATIKPEGIKILDQLSETLKTEDVDGKQVKVQGHTDNVPIGPTLSTTFPSNWELSKARAGAVAQYLIKQGGVDEARMSSVGHADTQPVASNATEEGRQKNRRVEIVLYPPTQAETHVRTSSEAMTEPVEATPVDSAPEEGGDLAPTPESAPEFLPGGEGDLPISDPAAEPPSTVPSNH